MRNKGFPVGCIILGAALWGLIGLFINHLSDYGSFDLLAVRSLFSSAGIFAFIGMTDRSKLKIQLHDLWMFIGTGIISFAAYNIFYTLAIRLTSMATAAVLLYTSPIFVTIMALFLFKEKLTGKKAAAVACAFIGCVLISGFSDSTAAGIVTGLMSGFCYALYSIFGRFALKKYASVTVTAYTFLFAFIVSAPLAKWGHIVGTLGGENLTWWILYAVFSGIVPYSLYTYGLAFVEAGRAAVMACIEPVVAALAGVFILHEGITVTAVMGICLILGAVVLLQEFKRK